MAIPDGFVPNFYHQQAAMVNTFTQDFNTPAFKGTTSFPVGLYIGGKFVEGVKGEKFE